MNEMIQLLLIFNIPQSTSIKVSIFSIFALKDLSRKALVVSLSYFHFELDITALAAQQWITAGGYIDYYYVVRKI
jgi:hypothetical protein